MKKYLFKNLNWLIFFEWFRKWIGGNYYQIKYDDDDGTKKWRYGNPVFSWKEPKKYYVLKINEFGPSEINPLHKEFRSMIMVRHGCDLNQLQMTYCPLCEIDFVTYSTEDINKKFGNAYSRLRRK